VYVIEFGICAIHCRYAAGFFDSLSGRINVFPFAKRAVFGKHFPFSIAIFMTERKALRQMPTVVMDLPFFVNQRS
jgi:hypothetical protein